MINPIVDIKTKHAMAHHTIDLHHSIFFYKGQLRTKPHTLKQPDIIVFRKDCFFDVSFVD